METLKLSKRQYCVYNSNSFREAFYIGGFSWRNQMKNRVIVFLMLACGVAIGSALVHASSIAKKTPMSPPATASISLQGKTLTINYSAPSMRGRAIMGALVSYDKVWRTGANAATTFTTATDVIIGPTSIPAGTYTLYTLPSEKSWKLIINKQVGQWGTIYNEVDDVTRVDMKKTDLSTPQEVMSISFENTQGGKTELHIRWEKTDVSVPIARTRP
jgi:hypothetical protein